MLWVKALHIIFITSWFAGLFYLPRLFVNHAMSTDHETIARLKLMEHKLIRFMTPLGILALIFGIWLWSYFDFYMGPGWRWMHVKLTLVAVLIAYHGWCWKICKDFAANRNARSHRWFRFFNEIPVLVLAACVILVVVKPF
ncbi:CopD family protein [Iodobacter arcticus]|uniref:Protoporphyrinogen IX oxidase n=1 Tax=Iodobacter arcticus TaxID=590593 RepID=A0ABW2QU03_9NEIS